MDTQKYLEAIENTRIFICSARIFHSAMFSIQPFSKQMNLSSPELSGEPALSTGSELDFRKMGVQFYIELRENSVALNTSCGLYSWFSYVQIRVTTLPGHVENFSTAP